MKDPFWWLIVTLLVAALVALPTQPLREAIEARPITPASPGAVRPFP